MSKTRLVARYICHRKGHIRPVRHWSVLIGSRHCSRCGAEVEPRIDMSGHP
jgi:hypothetical protein